MASPEISDRAKKFITEHTRKLRPLETAGSKAWWDASISGKAEDFDNRK